ncbi:MAG: mechanosensitive ion channel family protein [Bacteroidetes bacterium]|nr:mechanosensitive ion channel family protein [Bacteroidota bacterium]
MQTPDSLTTQNQPIDLLDASFWSTFGIGLGKVALIIGLAVVVLALARRLKARWVRSVQELPTLDKKRQRVLTVADLMGSITKYAVWTVTVILVIGELGINIAPLLAGAGIAGLAIGFGAQTLVRDIISGFFLLFDDTIGIGDRISFGGETGTVEYLGLRLIKVRKFDGELVMIPAGELRTFGNHSIGYSRVIVNVSLSYDQDINHSLEALNSVAQQWAKMEEISEILVDDEPQVQGVVDLSERGPTVRVVAQVQPGEQFQAERLLRLLIKQRFDQLGIEMQVPRSTVYFRQMGSGGSGEAPSET